MGRWLLPRTLAEYKINRWEPWDESRGDLKGIIAWRWVKLEEIPRIIYSEFLGEYEPFDLLKMFARIRVAKQPGLLIAVPLRAGTEAFPEYRAHLLRPRMDLPLREVRPPAPFWLPEDLNPQKEIWWREWAPCSARLEFFFGRNGMDQYPLYVSALWAKAVLNIMRREQTANQNRR